MTSKTYPPAWALHEAARRCNYPPASTDYWQWFLNVNNAYGAVCDLLVQHEQPPRADLRSVGHE